MAILNDLDVDAHAALLGYAPSFSKSIPWDDAHRVLAHAIWTWFDLHREDKIVTINAKVWFIPIHTTVKVKNLEVPITLIFGGRPEATPPLVIIS